MTAPADDQARKEFLRRLRRWNGVATSNDLGQFVDRKVDRARQWCRRNGLVTFEGGYWRLTERGTEIAKDLG